ncbi:MAG: GntR family transcriptional regulator [Proteobacteria bacterium]|nr:GntR family transcriptional regulator [Pseudomonadota bacterium]MBS0494083.1 GntR family transcriptional regulator [Pseudomonadota bacterium]
MAKRSAQSAIDDPAPSARTLIEQAYAQLRDDIVTGQLGPGERLRVEHLRTDYGVSAGTLREAITRLASDALVVTEGQRGFRVAPIALEELEDITDLRVQIETMALRQSIRAGDSQWRERVSQAFAAISAEEPIAPERRRRWERLNAEFHEALLSGHASAWTVRVLRLLSRHTERYRSFAMALPGAVRDVHAEHSAIFQFAMTGQEARAALALEAHIRTTPDLLMQALRDGRVALPGSGITPI